MRIPYDNGKVKIGIYYEPPKYVESDPDMIAIQGWFIGCNKAARQKLIAERIYTTIVVIAIILMMFYK
jgi:hypothetical protein